MKSPASWLKERRAARITHMFNELSEVHGRVAAELPNIKSSPYTDLSNVPERSRPSLEHMQADLQARKDVILFLNDFLLKSWSEVAALHDATPPMWRNQLLNKLAKALRELVPSAALSQHHRIRMLQSQGYEHTTRTRAFYIQRDVAEAIGDIGNDVFLDQEESVYKLAEAILLRAILEILIEIYARNSKSGFTNTIWYCTTLFCEFVQWSHREGPFKQHINRTN